MHGISRQVLETQASEALEIAIEGAQYCAVLDGDGGEVRITDQVSATSGTHQEADEQRGVAVGGTDDPCTRVRKAFIDET